MILKEMQDFAYENPECEVQIHCFDKKERKTYVATSPSRKFFNFNPLLLVESVESSIEDGHRYALVFVTLGKEY